MPDYQNAVTDQLTLFAFSGDISFCVRSKSNSVKYFVEATQALSHEHKAVLSSSIFAKTTIVHCNSAFVLCPKGLSPEEQQDYFNLNQPHSGILYNESLSDKIDCLYAPHSTLAVDELLVNPVHTSDVKVLHDYKNGLSQSNVIYLSILENKLLIRVYSGTKTLMINRFDAASTEEILYFVLFAVEQLKVDIKALHFEFTGDQEMHQKLKALFQNYLPLLLKMPALDLNTSQLSDAHQKAWSSDWWPSLALQCV